MVGREIFQSAAPGRTGAPANHTVVHDSACDANRLSTRLAPRYKCPPAVVYWRAVRKLLPQYFGPFLYKAKVRTISFSYFAASTFGSKKQKCMLLKTFNDEHILCTKCLSFIIHCRCLSSVHEDLNSRRYKSSEDTLPLAFKDCAWWQQFNSRCVYISLRKARLFKLIESNVAHFFNFNVLCTERK